MKRLFAACLVVTWGYFATPGQSQPAPISRLTSADGTVKLTPSGGYGPWEDLSAPGGAGGAATGGAATGSVTTGLGAPATNGIFVTISQPNSGMIPSLQALYTGPGTNWVSANITNRFGNTNSAQSYGAAYDYVHNTWVMSFNSDYFYTFSNNLAWSNAANPLLVLHSNLPVYPWTGLSFGSLQFVSNSSFTGGCLKILIGTNGGTYLDYLYVPALPEGIVSVDPVTFASNAPTVWLGPPTNFLGQVTSNVAVGFAMAPDGTWYAAGQAQWDSPVGGSYVAQPTAGRFYPTNCIVHYSATGNQLSILSQDTPLENVQGLAYCQANNCLYAIGNDMSASANWYAGGRLCIFKMTLSGAVTEVWSWYRSGGAEVPNSLCFPYPAAPYLAAFSMNYGPTKWVVTVDLSGTNVALAVDAQGNVGVLGPTGITWPNLTTMTGFPSSNTIVTILNGGDFVIGNGNTSLHLLPGGGLTTSTSLFNFNSMGVTGVSWLAVLDGGITSTGSIVGPIDNSTNANGWKPLFGPSSNNATGLTNANGTNLVPGSLQVPGTIATSNAFILHPGAVPTFSTLGTNNLNISGGIVNNLGDGVIVWWCHVTNTTSASQGYPLCQINFGLPFSTFSASTLGIGPSSAGGGGAGKSWSPYAVYTTNTTTAVSFSISQVGAAVPPGYFTNYLFTSGQ